MIKICKTCGQSKDEEEFPYHDKHSGTRKAHCKPCHSQREKDRGYNRSDAKKAKERERYLRNREKVIARTKEYGKMYPEVRRKATTEFRKRRYAEFLEYKKTLKCEQCGESHPGCLDFHHLDPTKKDYQISDLVMSKKKLIEELSKCVVLCANCHRKLHWKESHQNQFEEE